MVEKLKGVYFKNATNVNAIRSANIALLSDLYINDSVLKTIVLQANVNNKGKDKSQHRNTFLYRLNYYLGLK